MKVKPQLAAKLAAYGLEIAAAFGPESDGGKKLTPAEARKLLSRGLTLLASALIGVG
jgi:hypothetical protein